MKLPAYARAGVPEVWLVDLPGDRLVVHRGPGREGYGDMRGLERGEQVASAAFPDVAFSADEILG